MTTARLLSRPVVRVTSCSSGHNRSHPPSWMRDAGNGEGTEKSGHKWPPMSLVAGKSTKMTGPEAVVRTTPLIPLIGSEVVDLPAVWATVVASVAELVRFAQSTRPTKAQIQMLLEKGIVNCRFFTLLAVGGSLLGSILCFVEGSVMIFKSYFKYFHALSHRVDVGCVAHLLIEAIDMFIMGTAMLIFGMGLYTMFVGAENTEKSKPQVPDSNLFGLFSLKTMPSWVELNSLSQAKSRVGHAIMMILQVGILEKFKNIPLVTCLDLACFAGAVVVSSACIFVLAQLSMPKFK